MTAKLTRQDQRLLLSGAVTFGNAQALYQQGLPLLNSTQPPTALDLSQLSQSNTITVTVFVQWLRQRLLLSGAVTFGNAKALYQQGLPPLDSAQPPTLLDLSQLSQSNTIAVAVIVQWLRQLKPTQSLQLVNVPEKLQAIMRASNLERLLPS